MSATGLAVFDRTLQATHIWLDEIMQRLGPDRQVAWKVLSTVLHKLRDNLTPDLAAHLAAQLPLLVRGVFYDQYEPSRQPARCRSRADFVAEVDEWLADTRPINAEQAIQTVFQVLSHHLDPGEVAKVRNALPEGIRELWSVGAPA